MNTGSNRSVKKRCPACEREFTGTLVVCQHDGTLLIPVKESIVGQVLANKYHVLQEVGSGGMSIVYKGRHEVMDRTVAIKMLQSQLLGDQNSILRFQREAQAVACVNHPNVITIYDCDVHNGQPYLVMDFLTGVSLADIIRRENHINVDRVLKIFIIVTDALHHAHQKGVIHRDLKSSNIMLVDTENAREVVKVVDFGIAKLMPSSGKQSQNLTQTGEIFGSPIYMSPEQCQGMPLDARSDIYSCGVMMYEALTGLPPLMGETIVDTMQMHVASRPHPFAEVRPDLYIPTPLEQVVFRSLEKNPDSRFQSMEELKEILEHVQRKLAGANIQLESTANRQAVQQQREIRSTRPHMSASYAPNQLPKPMLDAPTQREHEGADMQTQSQAPSSYRRRQQEESQSQSSYRRRQQEESQSQSSYRRRNSETGSRASAQGMSVFNIEEPDEEEDDDGDKQKVKIGWMIPVSIVMFIAALLGIIALVVTHSH